MVRDGIGQAGEQSIVELAQLVASGEIKDPLLLERAVNILRAYKRKRCLDSLYYFAEHVLRDKDDPDELPLGAIHEQMCAEIALDVKRKLLLWPRGHLKSTLASRAYPIWRLLRDPDLRIIIASAKLDLAKELLANIKAVYEKNEEFVRLFGDWVDPNNWLKDRITVKPRTKAGREAPSIRLASTGSPITGSHADLIICDDLVNEEWVRSAEAIETTIRFYKELGRVLDPGGEMLVIGTRWAYTDLYSFLMEQARPGGRAQGKWHVSVRSIYHPGTERPVWPEKFTPALVEEIKAEQGPYDFAAQYLLNPVPDDQAVLKREWLRYYELAPCAQADKMAEDGNPLRIAITLDPAARVKDRADYSAFWVEGRDRSGLRFVLDIYRDRLEPHEQIEKIFELYEKWTQHTPYAVKVGIETVGFQDILRTNLIAAQRRRGRHFFIVECKATRVSKTDRIKALAPAYANGSVWLPTACLWRTAAGKMVDMLVEFVEREYVKFPLGPHDDLLDSQAMQDQVHVIGGGDRRVVNPNALWVRRKPQQEQEEVTDGRRVISRGIYQHPTRQGRRAESR